MNRNVERAKLLIHIKDYLLTHRQPVSQADLARHFEADPSKISRAIRQLENEIGTVLDRDARGRLSIDRDRYQLSVTLTLHQALAVFLAARLLARYSDKPNPNAVAALAQLSYALRKFAPQIAKHIEVTSERINRPVTEHSRAYVSMLQTLTQAWAEGWRVDVVLQKDVNLVRPFDPYFIEPSAVGYLTYVIGFDHHSGDLRTFTIDRLVRVSLTATPYKVPPTFDPYTMLAGAWGVNWGKGELTEVVLRFAAGRVADRVRLSNWHETRVIDDLPDGRCELRIKVGSTVEMKPWIRQWGPDCEVVRPLELRAEIGEEMRRAGEIYKGQDANPKE